MKKIIVYECNRKKCPNCSDYCHHTMDPEFAVNFTKVTTMEKTFFVETVRKENYVQQESDSRQTEAPE